MEEEQLLQLINCCVFVRYDLHQERAVLVMLRDDFGWERRTVWLIVSKAALRSGRRSMLRWPESGVEDKSIGDSEKCCLCAVMKAEVGLK